MRLIKPSLAGIVIVLSNLAYADPDVIVNNNNTSNAQPQTQNSSCGNSQPTPDPRVPPAGVYSSNRNGYSQTIYTTGETKPYDADMSSNCNNNNVGPIQPYVMVQPPRPKPGPR